MARPDAVYAPPPERRSPLLAASGLLEIAVLMGASLAAAMAAQRMWSPGLAETLGLMDGSAPDFVASSVAMAVQFAAQYGVLFGLVAIVGLIRGRRSARSYALVPPAPEAPNPLAHGLVLGLIISIIPALVFVLQDIAPIGRDTPIWAVLRGVEQDWTYWLFMAVGSFALVPLLEEGAWRGYVLGRLTEGFGPGAAVLMTTLLFSVLHVQYLQADAAMLLTFAGLIIASLAFGFAVLRTGSLVPAVIAHVIINFPLPTELNMVKIAAGVIALVVFRRAVGVELSFWGRMISTLWVIPALAALGGVGFAIAAAPNAALYIAGGAVIAFLALGFLKRSAWSLKAD